MLLLNSTNWEVIVTTSFGYSVRFYL